jgi:hypothetical protein
MINRTKLRNKKTATASSGGGVRAMLGVFALAVAAPALASDGLIEINQTAVNAGGITPGDGIGFPATLSLPGSYLLTGNLTLPSEHSTGIEITTDGVTLDLNGFSINGPTICINGGSCAPVGTGDGIYSAAKDVTIRNGKVRGAGHYGVFLDSGSGARASVIERVEASNNGSTGIIGAAYGRIRGCVAYNNGGSGIGAGLQSVVLENTVSFNGLDGVAMGSQTTQAGGVVRGNSSFANGRYGFLVGSGASVMGNSANDNSSYGLRLGSLAGYGNNVLFDNNSGGNQKLGGRPMGNNVCEGVANDDC